MLSKISPFVFIIGAFLLLMLNGCSDRSSSSDPQVLGIVQSPNQKPIAKILVNQVDTNETNITVGDTVSFDASASSDPDGNIIAYEWRDGNGTLLTKGAKFDRVFDKNGSYEVILIVTDDKQESSQDKILIKVANKVILDPNPDSTPTNQSPVAKGKVYPLEINSMEKVYFQDDGSYDPDGDPITYKWVASNGVVLSYNKNWDINIPYEAEYDYDNDGIIKSTVTLYVTDSHGNVSSKSFEITVHKNNQAPTVDAVVDIGTHQVDYVRVPIGSKVKLLALANDSDGTIVSYEWRKQGDPTVIATTPSVTLQGTLSTLYVVSPYILSEGTNIFEVTVTDSDGATTTDTVVVFVYLTGI